MLSKLLVCNLIVAKIRVQSIYLLMSYIRFLKPEIKLPLLLFKVAELRKLFLALSVVCFSGFYIFF